MSRTSGVLRWLFAGCTAGVVVAGEVWLVSAGALTGRFNAAFAFWLLVGLAPCMIFALGVRSDRRVRLHGPLLLLVTLSAWVLLFLSTNEFAGLVLMAGFSATLAIAITAARQDTN